MYIALLQEVTGLVSQIYLPVYGLCLCSVYVVTGLQVAAMKPGHTCLAYYTMGMNHESALTRSPLTVTVVCAVDQSMLDPAGLRRHDIRGYMVTLLGAL